MYAYGWVGDADPMPAIHDALRRVRADELLIATHPQSSSSWLGRGLVERAVIEFGLPTAHLPVDLAPQRGELELAAA